MDIFNKTAEAIRVPVGAGRHLFLSVGRTGQISPKTAEMPAVKALIDNGSIGIKGIMASKPKRSKGSTQHGAGGGPAPGDGGVRYTGAR
jgi:hypothetical protein